MFFYSSLLVLAFISRKQSQPQVWELYNTVLALPLFFGSLCFVQTFNLPGIPLFFFCAPSCKNPPKHAPGFLANPPFQNHHSDRLFLTPAFFVCAFDLLCPVKCCPPFFAGSAECLNPSPTRLPPHFVTPPPPSLTPSPLNPSSRKMVISQGS